MKRSVFASALTLLFCSVTVSLAVAQAKPAVSQAKTTAPAAPAPASKAGFVTPLKGEGTILVLQGTSKFDPKLKEVTTTYKIKNMSSAPIAMLKMDDTGTRRARWCRPTPSATSSRSSRAKSSR